MFESLGSRGIGFKSSGLGVGVLPRSVESAKAFLLDMPWPRFNAKVRFNDASNLRTQLLKRRVNLQLQRSAPDFSARRGFQHPTTIAVLAQLRPGSDVRWSWGL